MSFVWWLCLVKNMNVSGAEKPPQPHLILYCTPHEHLRILSALSRGNMMNSGVSGYSTAGPGSCSSLLRADASLFYAQTPIVPKGLEYFNTFNLEAAPLHDSRHMPTTVSLAICTQTMQQC